MPIATVHEGQNISATHYNKLVRAINGLLDMKGDGLIQTRQVGDRITLSISVDALARRFRGRPGGAAAVGVAVYKVQSNQETAGQYNCYLQTWADGAWGNANADNVVVKDTLDSDNEFGANDLFIGVAAADDADLVPVVPYGQAHVRGT